MKVSQVMSKAIVIEDSISLKEASKIMANKGITNLIIAIDGKIMGIITDSDIIRNISNIDDKVSKVMSKKVITVDADQEIKEAGEIMIDKNLRRLPVTKNGKLAGAINFIDVIKHAGYSEEGDFFFN